MKTSEEIIGKKGGDCSDKA